MSFLGRWGLKTKHLQVLVGQQGSQWMIKSWIRERREEMSKRMTHDKQKGHTEWRKVPKLTNSGWRRPDYSVPTMQRHHLGCVSYLSLSLSLSQSNIFFAFVVHFSKCGLFNSAWTKQANKDILSQPKTTPARVKLRRELRRGAQWRLFISWTWSKPHKARCQLEEIIRE